MSELGHELDHLEGVLIIDRMSPAERTAADRRLRDLIRRREAALERQRSAEGASRGA